MLPLASSASTSGPPFTDTTMREQPRGSLPLTPQVKHSVSLATVATELLPGPHTRPTTGKVLSTPTWARQGMDKGGELG